MTDMAVTRRFKRTVSDRIRRDPAFARALLDEAANLFLNGEPETARATLRELVNATVGFERLAGHPASRRRACTGCSHHRAIRAWITSRSSSARSGGNSAWTFESGRFGRPDSFLDGRDGLPVSPS